jgi:hypothetical protein
LAGVSAIAARLIGTALTPVAGASGLALRSGESLTVGERNAFQRLGTILATSNIRTALPFVDTLGKFATRTASVFGDARQTITAFEIGTANLPFVGLARRYVTARLALRVDIGNAFETIAAIHAKTAILPFGHARGKVTALRCSIGKIDALQAVAATDILARTPFGHASRQIHTRLGTPRLLHAFEITAARSKRTTIGPFTDALLFINDTFLGETIYLSTFETVAAARDIAFTALSVTCGRHGFATRDRTRCSFHSHQTSINDAHDFIFAKLDHFRVHVSKIFFHGATVRQVAVHNIFEPIQTELLVRKERVGLFANAPMGRAIIIACPTQSVRQ